MKFLIAAAGTGGHVFPGLAVGEALLELGVAQDDVVYVGGDRLEADVYPSRGFHFEPVELAGLQRSLTLRNLRIPSVVLRARRRIEAIIDEMEIETVLGMGGYVTIPTGLAAWSSRVPFFNAEQNAGAGLANKTAARWARATFTAFETTAGLPDGKWVGNPVRRGLWDFDRDKLRPEALERYSLQSDTPVIGVFGGSLGAGAINDAVTAVLERWTRAPIQVVHLTGPLHVDRVSAGRPADGVTWNVLAFEEDMEYFYAASDLVVARAGGAVAELTATATPSVLVPGRFGSGSHQEENARVLEMAGAARVVDEGSIGELGDVLAGLINDPNQLSAMAAAAAGLSKPEAALTIARMMIEAPR